MKSAIAAFLFFVLIFSSLEGISKSKHKSYSRRNVDKKGYIGLSIGSSVPMGGYPENAVKGTYASWDFGYIFGNNLGINANSYSAINAVNDVNAQSTMLKVAILVGPSYRIKINDKINWDLKASGGFMVSDITNNIVVNNKPDFISGSGLAYNLGTSIRYNMWKNKYLGLNIDYLFAKQNYDGIMKNMPGANIGIGFGWLLK